VAFSKLKAWLRKAAERIVDGLYDVTIINLKKLSSL
jgi:hypothetical protein